MGRTWAIIERELRRFRRSPILIVVSMVFPLVQLIILGYAFGGNVKHLKLAIVDQDRGVPAVRVHELAAAAASGARTIDVLDYSDQGQAIADLRNGRVNGVLTIPPDFSRRVLAKSQPRVALIEDNTDNFVAIALAGTMGGLISSVRPERHVAASGHSANARPGGGLPLRSLRSVPAARIRGDVDLHDGHDRRGHHLHRRQGPGTSRGISRHADHEVRVDRGIQYLRNDQGRARRDVSAGDRLVHRRGPGSARSAQALSSLRRGGHHRLRAHQPDVPVDGAGHRPSAAACGLRGAEHAVVLP